MTEREMLLGIFSAVAGLAERVTGERMVVHIRDEKGDSFAVHGNAVTWEPVNRHLAADEAPTAPLSGP